MASFWICKKIVLLSYKIWLTSIPLGKKKETRYFSPEKQHRGISEL